MYNNDIESTYRVFSFQSKDFIDKLLKDGVVRTEYWRVGNSGNKKYDLYAPLLGDELEEDTIPIYTFLKHSIGFDEYPISAHTLQSSWRDFVGWYKLDGRHIIELEIPASAGVVGGIDSVRVADFNNRDERCLEFVVPYIKLEWVREIYIKDSNNLVNGNTLVEFTPLLNKYEDRMFSCPFIMGSEIRSGSLEFSEDFALVVEHKNIDMDDFLANNTPIVNKTYGYNISRLPFKKGCELYTYGMAKHFPTISSKDIEAWKGSIRELRYMIYN